MVEESSEDIKENPLKSKLEFLKDIFQDSNISFLIGSGVSCPYFGTLGAIEIWLTELEESKIDDELKLFIKASLYKAYFITSMRDNIVLRDFSPTINEYIDGSSIDIHLNNTYKAYKDFVSILNNILYLRRSNTVSKQVNFFTTNIDIFL